MKKYFKRGLSLLLVLMILVGVTSGAVVSASAAEYVYNWGTRGVTATYLSEAAEAFYRDNETDYTRLSTLSGSTAIGSVPSSPLYKQLQMLMEANHTHITDYGETRDLYQYTDCQNGGGAISAFYSGISVGPAWDGGATWNREHTWPNSKGLDGDDENDLMMLRPTAKSVNSSRGNKAYGESSGFYYPNAASNDTYDVRGDVARIMLYTYVRWGNTGLMWGSSGVMESKEVLLKWVEEDPVDTWELGRNDAVEAITGTRNVFVDYPELAFLLFAEEVPSGMQTPSGSAIEHYAINAVSNDSAQGTVSLQGQTITAVPAAGHEVVGYEILNGTATVTQTGNIFVVEAASDCTIQINFALKPAVAVCFWDNGTMVTGYAVPQDDIIILPTPTSAPEGYTFVGWTTGQISDSYEYPACLAAGSSYDVNGNTNLFAVYSYEEANSASENYVLVTDPSQLAIGSKVVIAAATANFALSTNQKNNNRGQAAITKNSDNTISWASGAGVAELTLGAGSAAGSYSLYCDANNGYLYCASSGNKNYLKTQKNVDAKASFAITVNGNGVCNVVSQTTSTDRNIMRYNPNNGDGLFACYKSGQQDLSLYVKTAGGTATYYTTLAAPTCTHDGAEFVAGTPASCVATGWTDGLYCGDCQSYVFGHEQIAASGHTPGTPVEENDGAKDYLVTYCDVCGEELNRERVDVHLPGDINGDGGINNKDATRLFQYLSGWSVEVVEAALDVNGDGSVNNKDATRLFQYLSGWNVDIF